MGVTALLSPSRLLAAVLIAAHVAGGACIAALGLPVWIKLSAAGALLTSLLFHLLRSAWLRLPDSIVALEARADASYAIRLRSGAWLACRLLGSSYVAPWLTIVNLQPEDARRPRHVLIAPDAIAAEDFRRLRVWLRWKAAAQLAQEAGAARDGSAVS